MTGKAEAALKQLTSLSKNLNEASDELSRQIATVESALNALNLGTWAWVYEPTMTEAELSEPDAKGQRYELNYVHTLGYGKHKGKWGLLVSSCWDYDDENAEITPLRDAPREVRLKAIDKIPELLEALVKEVAALTEEASKKASQARELASAISKKSR